MSLTGTILKNRYCILEQIGKGGEGHLYLARDMELGGVWAVKELPLSKKQEAAYLRKLSHPAIPKMIDYEETDQVCYLIMEYISGKSLGDYIKEGSTFSQERVLEIGVSVAQILEYLHNQKPPVYYGDLKPENLMLTETGKLFLVDFGSVVTGYEHRRTLCQGTRGYAAPEQYEGRVNASSDVYALGKTMCALLGKRKKGLWLRFFSMWCFLHKCCKKQEDKRFSNMKEVRAGLEILQKRRHRKKEVGKRCLFVAFMFSILAFVFLTQKTRTTSYADALSSVTSRYYQVDFLEGSKKQRRKICQDVENRLQRLLKQYTGREEQRQLLLLLGINGEYLGEEERTSLYYEQLILYDPGYAAAYGEYGMFLLKQNKEEKSRELWDVYQKQKNDKQLEKTANRNLKMWEGYMLEMEKEKK